MIKLVQIAPRLIAAAFEFQAKADDRYMLNGMLIEPDTVGRIHIEVTAIWSEYCNPNLTAYSNEGIS